MAKQKPTEDDRGSSARLPWLPAEKQRRRVQLKRTKREETANGGDGPDAANRPADGSPGADAEALTDKSPTPGPGVGTDDANPQARPKRVAVRYDRTRRSEGEGSVPAAGLRTSEPAPRPATAETSPAPQQASQPDKSSRGAYQAGGGPARDQEVGVAPPPVAAPDSEVAESLKCGKAASGIGSSFELPGWVSDAWAKPKPSASVPEPRDRGLRYAVIEPADSPEVESSRDSTKAEGFSPGSELAEASLPPDGPEESGEVAPPRDAGPKGSPRRPAPPWQMAAISAASAGFQQLPDYPAERPAAPREHTGPAPQTPVHPQTAVGPQASGPPPQSVQAPRPGVFAPPLPPPPPVVPPPPWLPWASPSPAQQHAPQLRQPPSQPTDSPARGTQQTPPPGWVPQAPAVPPPNHWQLRVPPPIDAAEIIANRMVPRSGWRRAVHKATSGHINPGISRKERRQDHLLAEIRQPIVSEFRIAVLSIKGGVGKTTTTFGLGSALATARQDRVIAVDANPDRGTLGERVGDSSSRSTVRDLLSDPNIYRYADVRNHTLMATSRLEVLASEQDPAVSEVFGADDYRRTVDILRHFYNIVLTDCGTGIMHSAMSAILDLAHSIVLVSSPALDAARSASATLDWLMQHGHSDLVRDAHVVLSASRPGSAALKLDKVYEHFQTRCRSIHLIPFDPHLAEGADVDFGRLRAATRQAYLELAGSVAQNFGRLRAPRDQ